MYKEEFMKEALLLANEAFKDNEVPVGAVIVKNNQIVSKGKNKRESLNNSLAHAEIDAINNACNKLHTWRLDECDMYVTLEPCPMCAGAILNSRIKNLYIGTSDENFGACGSKIDILALNNTYHINYTSGYLEDECKKILNDFFNKIRKGTT